LVQPEPIQTAATERHVAEDDPDSDLNAESPDASAVIAYMKSHS
jgi:hypothetical protein